jgi:hypothetical protein
MQVVANRLDASCREQVITSLQLAWRQETRVMSRVLAQSKLIINRSTIDGNLYFIWKNPTILPVM